MAAFLFPNSPTIGDIANNYTWDGQKWIQIPASPNLSGVIAIKVFTTSGTYVPSSNMTTCVIECWGGGGGGGAVQGVATSSFVAGGGGGGGYSRSTLTAAAVSASTKAIAIGAGGASPFSAGGAGGATTFGGTIVVANGGSGGVATIASTSGGAGGAAGTGDLAVPGPNATPAGGSVNATSMTLSVGSTGGTTTVGSGGGGGRSSASAGHAYAATGYGSGGGGASVCNAALAANGTVGMPGLCVITEYGMTALTGTDTGAVRYDLLQGLTTPQQAVARANIGVTKKNYIINGAMMISQENGATAGTTTNYYPADQFFISYGNGGTVALGQMALTTPAGSPMRVRFSCTGADTSVAAGDYSAIVHNIEGLRVADLLLGTASAKTVTLQFGVRAPAGTYCVMIGNGAGNRHYVAEYVISAGEANTDVVRSIVVPLDTSGTWATNNTTGISMQWTLMCGATYQTTPNSWVGGNVFGTANQFNFMGTNGNNFDLFDVSLTEGTVAPPYQVPDYPSELALCQRYYAQFRFSRTYVSAAASHTDIFPHKFPVFMRATAAVTLANVTTSNTATYGVSAGNETYCTTYMTGTVAGYANTTTTATIVANARL